jgi:hypothetical protein
MWNEILIHNNSGAAHVLNKGEHGTTSTLLNFAKYVGCHIDTMYQDCTLFPHQNYLHSITW